MTNKPVVKPTTAKMANAANHDLKDYWPLRREELWNLQPTVSSFYRSIRASCENAWSLPCRRRCTCRPRASKPQVLLSSPVRPVKPKRSHRNVPCRRKPRGWEKSCLGEETLETRAKKTISPWIPKNKKKIVIFSLKLHEDFFCDPRSFFEKHCTTITLTWAIWFPCDFLYVWARLKMNFCQQLSCSSSVVLHRQSLQKNKQNSSQSIVLYIS